MKYLNLNSYVTTIGCYSFPCGGKSMYVNGYIIPVLETNKDSFIAFMKVFVEVAKDFGVLEIFENWELEVPDGNNTDYRKAVKALPGEKIVFSWVVWQDREKAKVAHKGIFADPRMEAIEDIPFDGSRMIMGGFEPLCTYNSKLST